MLIGYKIKQSREAAKEKSMAEIRELNGRPAIFINDKPYPPMMATIRTMNEGKEIIFDRDYFKNLGESGNKYCKKQYQNAQCYRNYDRRIN